MKFRLTFDKKIWLFYAGIALVMIILAVISLKNEYSDIKDRAWIDYEYSFLRKVTDIRALAKDNVINTGSFIITGDTSLLSVIHTANAQAFRTLDELGMLTLGQDAHHKSVDTLASKVRLLFEHTAGIEKRNVQWENKPAAQLQAISAANLMIRGIVLYVATIENREYQSIANAKRSYAASQRAFMLTIFLMAAAVLVLLVTSFVIIRTQIRKRKRAEEDLRQVNAGLEEKVTEKTEKLMAHEIHYRHILDNMLEGVQIIGNDWRYKYMNDAAVRHSRFRREELVGFRMAEKYPGVQSTALYGLLESCLKEKRSAYTENEFTFPDGSTGYFALSIEPVPEGLFILSMDASERKAIEKEKEKRIKETQQILFKISHEVRIPVVNILGIANMLDDAATNKQELQLVCDSMKHSALLLDEHTRNLTSYISSLTSLDDRPDRQLHAVQ